MSRHPFHGIVQTACLAVSRSGNLGGQAAPMGGQAEAQVKSQKSNKKLTQPHLLGDLLGKYQLEDKGGYITQEFQDYGYRLACEMGEEGKKAMYIKLAKNEKRVLLERARSYVLDAPNVKHKGKLFLWVLSKLKKGDGLGDGAEARVREM